MTRRFLGICSLAFSLAVLLPGQAAPDTGVGAAAAQQLVKVPKVVGNQERAAAAILERFGLQVGQVSRQPSREPPGQVIAQGTPPGQEVPQGTAIDLVVAAPLTAAVPPIVGRTQADAAARLERAGLAAGEVTLQESRSPRGLVLSQRPPAGQVVAAGTAVDMVVATPVTVGVPRLVGRTQDDAIGMLRKVELMPGEVSSAESRRPEGTVLSQKPEAGAKAAVGTAVDLVVARPVTVLVPSLVGRTQAQAGELLKRAGLVAGEVSSAESRRRAGTVLSQDPAAERRVVIGTSVDFVVARPVTVQVPSLVGRTRAAAAGLLGRAELALGGVTSQEARRPPGTVLSQQPAAGTIVTIGSAVTIVTATPVTVLVPDLASKPEAEARQALEKVELAVGAVTTRESRSPAGSVLSQSVAAGTRVPIGTLVNLTTAVPVTVVVPTIVGVSERDARARLAAVELKAGTIGYRESPRPGTVMTQGVAQGKRVPIGTAVDFVLGVVETVPVPSVVGLTVEKARDVLKTGRLAVGGEELRPTHLQPEGTVLAQSVRAGTRRAVGSAVRLTVAAIEMVAVPRVVGLEHGAAAAAITAAGLTVGAVTPRLSIQAGGTVLAQSVPVNQQVPYGTAVLLDEARPRVVWMVPVGGVIVLVAVVAGLAGVGRRRKRAPKPAPEPQPAAPPAEGVGVRTHVDPGEADVRPHETPAIKMEVRITPVVDRGAQGLVAPGGDLIQGERREKGSRDDAD